jgi:hypothetical protein
VDRTLGVQLMIPLEMPLKGLRMHALGPEQRRFPALLAAKFSLKPEKLLERPVTLSDALRMIAKAPGASSSEPVSPRGEIEFPDAMATERADHPPATTSIIWFGEDQSYPLLNPLTVVAFAAPISQL